MLATNNDEIENLEWSWIQINKKNSQCSSERSESPAESLNSTFLEDIEWTFIKENFLKKQHQHNNSCSFLNNSNSFDQAISYSAQEFSFSRPIGQQNQQQPNFSTHTQSNVLGLVINRSNLVQEKQQRSRQNVIVSSDVNYNPEMKRSLSVSSNNQERKKFLIEFNNHYRKEDKKKNEVKVEEEKNDPFIVKKSKKIIKELKKFVKNHFNFSADESGGKEKEGEETGCKENMLHKEIKEFVCFWLKNFGLSFFFSYIFVKIGTFFHDELLSL
ncbi:hypothetical protein HK099_006144 [Clydaea vesicula]|uniref:Uncharacterized protein n=1 Tax=Clydaea vesicula TaxID=447962 RepID=A0AAD5TXX7_9FUNG|nr:hypothetical protein HK099_006144 [Clydaea vesicula]